ncbi:MAG: hypothetical protein HY908_01055 [Myxococcales bacterium]|nr:hypothetical protein [Myxococcales bacterium]
MYRGLDAYCSGCGKPRSLLSGTSLTHAGKPARLAGGVVHAFGWIVLVVGLGVAALVGLLLTPLFGATTGAVTGGIFALLTLLAFAVVRRGGRHLESSGDATRDRRREQALLALAANRGGRVQALEAAPVLDVSLEEADQILTRIAKTQPYDVAVELGDEGEIFYVFKQVPAGQLAAPGPVGVRVAGAPAPAAAPPAAEALVAEEAAATAEADARARR